MQQIFSKIIDLISTIIKQINIILYALISYFIIKIDMELLEDNRFIIQICYDFIFYYSFNNFFHKFGKTFNNPNLTLL